MDKIGMKLLISLMLSTLKTSKGETWSRATSRRTRNSKSPYK